MSDPVEIQIVKALRERLTDDGFAVHLGEWVDPQDTDLPAVVLGHTPDAIQTVDQRFPSKATMTLVADLWYRIDQTDGSDDILIQGLTQCRKIRTALVDRPPTDRPDTIGELADKVEHSKTVVMTEDEQSLTGLAQVQITITYYDEG